MNPFWWAFIDGLVGGSVGGFAWLWYPPERRRRARRHKAFVRLLAAQRAVARGDQLAVYCHVEDALTLLENRDPLPSPDELRDERMQQAS